MGEGEREQGVGGLLIHRGSVTGTSGFDSDGEVGRGRYREELQGGDDGTFAETPLSSFFPFLFFSFKNSRLWQFNWGIRTCSKIMKFIRVAPTKIMMLTIFLFEFFKCLTWFQNSKLICNYLKSSFLIEAFKPFYKICKIHVASPWHVEARQNLVLQNKKFCITFVHRVYIMQFWSIPLSFL